LAAVLGVGGSACTSGSGAPKESGEAAGGTGNRGGELGASGTSGHDGTAGGGRAAEGTGGTNNAGAPGSAGMTGGAGRAPSGGGQGGAGSAGTPSSGSGGATTGAGGATSGSGGRSSATGGAGPKAGRGGASATGGRGGAESAAGQAGTTGAAGAGATGGPCDIYAAGNAPCVAAHSTVRALLAAYSGKLYQIKRASDGMTQDIGVESAGGFADAASQDTFCAGTTCTIPIVYDQSGKGNHLTVAPAGGNGSADVAADAAAQKLTIGGHTVYAIYVAAGVGYRNNKTTGVATGSGAEGEYMVASGKHVNDGCCFDYGNAETNSKDNGNGHMEAVYLGKLCWFTPCNGSGPWVMADLENGLFAGGNGKSSDNTSVAYDYVTALVKGDSTNYAIKGGNSQSGMLKTMYSGGLPTTTGYNPMHKEGAIILGIGGDNSKVAVGTFFEGALTSGYPSDATDDAVQANIVAAGYGN
jgi:hypothetical protein